MLPKWASTEIGCSDPQAFHDRIALGLNELNITEIELVLYNSTTLLKYVNDSSVDWSKRTNEEYNTCYTMTLTSDITDVGVRSVKFIGRKQTWLLLYTHQKGLFLSDMPGASPSTRVNSKSFMFPLEHEEIELYEYDGQNCNHSKDYMFDECRHDYVYRVNIHSF